jgi:methionine-S-sulfoxide reductase
MIRLLIIVPVILAVMSDSLAAENRLEEAIFAGGCFWCMEPPFEKLDGVEAVISGYTGGDEKNPSYEEVSSGKTGHVEAVLVKYDPSKISYRELVETFWRQIDPTDDGGQFADRGPQYRTAIFYRSEEQKKIAEQSRQELQSSGRFSSPVVTQIIPAGEFYPAEDYHQDYYRKNPLRYKIYRFGSGRDRFLKENWKEKSGLEKRSRYIKPSPEEDKGYAHFYSVQGHTERRH